MVQIVPTSQSDIYHLAIDISGKFVPILPYYLDILSGYNFGKKTAKVSMKPMDFSCIVKCSKSQLTENGFKGNNNQNDNEVFYQYIAKTGVINQFNFTFL